VAQAGGGDRRCDHVVLLALFVRVQVDTDPESMLSADAPVRVLNEEIRTTFGTRDMVVVGLFSDGVS
jgi:predicted RND superfamily exporter protein